MRYRGVVVKKMVMIDRRRFLQGVGAAISGVILFGVVACGDADSPEAADTAPTTVGIALIPGTNSLAPEFTEAKGWFLDEGIQIREFVMTFEPHETLLAGAVDMLTGGADQVILANLRGADLIIVGVMDNRPMQFMIVDESIESLQDLEGRRVGVLDLAASDFPTISRLLENTGLDPDTVQFVNTGGSRDRLAALEAGQIEGATFDPLTSHIAIESGHRLLATPDDLEEWPWNVFVVEREWAHENEAAMVGLMRALRRSMQFMNDPSNEEEVLQTLDGASETPIEDIRAAFGLLREHNITLYDFMAPEASQLQPLVDHLRAAGEIDGDVDLESMIEPRYWNEANG